MTQAYTNNNSAYVILIDIKNVASVHNNQSEELNKSIQMSFNRMCDSVNKISKHDALLHLYNSQRAIWGMIIIIISITVYV